jgi:hypothetical protein
MSTCTATITKESKSNSHVELRIDPLIALTFVFF